MAFLLPTSVDYCNHPTSLANLRVITVESFFIILHLDVTKNFWQNTNQFSWVIQFYISNHPSLPNKFSFLGDDCWYSLRPRQVIKAIGAAGRSMLDTWRKDTENGTRTVRRTRKKCWLQNFDLVCLCIFSQSDSHFGACPNDSPNCEHLTNKKGHHG